MNIYYKKKEDIINNYNNKNRNYEILYNINKIKDNIKLNSVKSKFNNIFDIYCNMNINEINIIYNNNDDNKIQIFGHNFVQRNKNNCKIIINGK